MKYYFKAFKNYANGEGRATRREYWWFMFFHYIIMLLLSFLDGVFGFYSTDIPLDYGYMTIIYMFASACPSICLQVRRLHDVGKSGSWWWVKNVPFFSLYLFYFNLKPSEPATNVYGPPAKYITKTVCNEDKQTDNSSKVRFCRKCGYELVNGSDFCSRCGTEVLKPKLTNILDTQKFEVVIFDTSVGKMRTEIRKVDVKKFPPEKFSDNNTYYAVETIKEGKKVRIYCTKDNWKKKVEINKAAEV